MSVCRHGKNSGKCRDCVRSVRAAAPDLLAALRDMLEPFAYLPDSTIVETIRRGSFSFGGIDLFQLKRIAAARAAIAKAESRVG